jgi:hypothetical protein
MHFSPNIYMEKLMLPSEIAPHELSNEWSCFDNLKYFGQFLCPARP